MNKLPIITFKNAQEWHAWLEDNHALSEGIWIRFFKKNSGKTGITYEEALDEALCFGWIDSLAKRLDDISYIQRFTPRKSKSIWSKTNTHHIERLTREGRMHPAGLLQVENAKKDGRWKIAYHPPSTMEIPADFLRELSHNKKAETFFRTLNKTNIYAIAWRIQTAKKIETRKKRIEAIIAMLTKEEKLH